MCGLFNKSFFLISLFNVRREGRYTQPSLADLKFSAEKGPPLSHRRTVFDGTRLEGALSSLFPWHITSLRRLCVCVCGRKENLVVSVSCHIFSYDLILVYSSVYSCRTGCKNLSMQLYLFQLIIKSVSCLLTRLER